MVSKGKNKFGKTKIERRKSCGDHEVRNDLLLCAFDMFSYGGACTIRNVNNCSVYILNFYISVKYHELSEYLKLCWFGWSFWSEKLETYTRFGQSSDRGVAHDCYVQNCCTKAVVSPLYLIDFVFRQDLESGHKKAGHYEEMLSVLLGDQRYNQRARPYNATVENQVACLIDQATDPNLLGRTYHGWEPWV